MKNVRTKNARRAALLCLAALTAVPAAVACSVDTTTATPPSESPAPLTPATAAPDVAGRTALEWSRAFSAAQRKGDAALVGTYDEYLRSVTTERASQMAKELRADWLEVPRVLFQKVWLESKLGRFNDCRATLRALEAFAGPTYPLSTLRYLDALAATEIKIDEGLGAEPSRIARLVPRLAASHAELPRDEGTAMLRYNLALGAFRIDDHRTALAIIVPMLRSDDPADRKVLDGTRDARGGAYQLAIAASVVVGDRAQAFTLLHELERANLDTSLPFLATSREMVAERFPGQSL